MSDKPGPDRPGRGPLRPSGGLGVVLGAALLVAFCLWRGASVTLLGFAGAVLALGACIWLVMAVISALRRAHDLRLLQPGSGWRLVLGGHVLRLVVAVPVALWSAACIALALVAEPGRTLAGAGLILGLILILGPLVARRFVRVIIADQAVRFTQPVVILLAGSAALLLSLILRAAPGDLAEAVGGALRYTGSSALLGQIFDAYAVMTGAGEVLRGAGLRGFLIGLLIEGGIWFGLATALSLALLPLAILARILAPEGRPAPATLALAGFLVVVLCTALLTLLAAFEARVQMALGPLPPVPVSQAPVLSPPALPSPAPVGIAPADGAARRPGLPVLPSNLRASIEGERIGTLFCPPGTVAELTALEERLAAIHAAQASRLRESIGTGFDAMRGNVGPFLDWYYSLGAEYLRTLNLLIGNGEDYLRGRIDNHLGAGDPMGAVGAELAAIAGASNVGAEVEAARRAIMVDCGIEMPSDLGAVTITASRTDDRIALPLLADRITLETRLGAAGFSGLAAGAGVAVLAKVGGKVMLSSAFKAAAAALVKIAGSKALSVLGGAGMGAAAGAAGGSVVPGAGTTAGAVLGGVAGGIAVMLGVDFGLIKLEEAVSRAAFEADLIAAITATEAELLAALGL